jgi:uncharacterized membrane protein YbhN (UPF0104 family)
MDSTPKRSNTPVWNILKIILAVFLVGFIISRTDLPSLWETLKSASLPWLFLATIIFLLLTVLKALQYYVLFRNGLTYPQVLNVLILQNAVSNYLAPSAGIASYLTVFRVEHGVKVSRSVLIFVLTKIGDLTAIWLGLLISSVLIWPRIRVLQALIIVLLTGIGLVILVFFITVLFRQGFVLLLRRVLGFLKLSKIGIVEKGISYFQGLADMDQTKVLSTFGLLLLYSFVYLAVTIVYTYANLAIFHLKLEFLAVALVTILIQLVSYFPVSVFGGLGVTEASALYFWSFLGIPDSILAPALLGTRIVFYVVNLIPLIYLPLYSAFLKPKEQAQHG